REETPRVFLISSIEGGAGSGMVLEMGYAVRQILEQMGIPDEGVCGFLFHSLDDGPAQREMSRVNAFATLTELAHYSRPTSAYPGDPEHGLLPGRPGRPPFEECYLADLSKHS